MTEYESMAHKPGYLPRSESKPRYPAFIPIDIGSVHYIFHQGETEMTKNFRSFLKYSVLVVLIAVTALSFLSCEKDAETTGAEITITVEVVHKSGESTEHTLTTTKTTLADALLEASLASGNEDTYGLYITTVDGETADYSVDQSYWALSKDGEALMTGASDTKIADGEHYELTYTVFAE